jgi:solute carrier family 13 (sodium-dependent dicarboxylate transporter), member 2/3/5
MTNAGKRPDFLRIAALLLGVGLLIATPLLPLAGLELPGRISLGIFLMAAVFWLTEPVPIYATSLLVIFLQIMLLGNEGWLVSSGWVDFEGTDYRAFTGTLAHPIIVLFLGGFMLAAAAVKFDLDKNLTRVVMRPFGERPSMILCGLMLVTALLSAFMSNTATTAMMMTVILPVIAMLPEGDRFRVAVALAIPTAANVGGIATPIGTPPNAIVIAALANDGIRISFSSWMLLMIPLVIIVLLASWALLLLLYPAGVRSLSLSFSSRFQKSPKALALYFVFGFTVLLWMTEALHGMGSNVVAFFPVAALPLLGILGKKDIRNLPWEVLWLVAGGISLGVSLQNTGLAAWLVGLIDWGSMGGLTLLSLFALVTFLMANFLSHTVTATLITPLALGIGAGLAEGTSFNPVLGGLVIAVASSLGMSLPISTPPNAIAMSTGLVQTKDMALVGLILGIGGLLLGLLFAKFYWPLFSIS